jgi:hypothetical protein
MVKKEIRQKITNPKCHLKMDLEALDIVEIKGEKYRFFTTTFKHVNDGSCQCYKDCNCSELKGEVTVRTTTWYRNLKFDGTDKCFYSEPYTPAHRQKETHSKDVPLKKDGEQRANYLDRI